MPRNLIVNADDFGASAGVNRGIVECHRRGIVTSTSLMVTGRAAAEAVAMSRDCPGLSLGLHWDVVGEDEREFDDEDLVAVRDEFSRQLEGFERLVGKLPTHLDSHRHYHRKPHLRPLFQEIAAGLGLPLRDEVPVRYVSHFYAQWEWKVTNLEYVGVPFLEKMLREEAGEGWTEFSCHPGYPGADYQSVYDQEREVEVRTLTDPRIRAAVERLGISLRSYADVR
jgi:predicted glycoside hydrolase/deacetylase ChbG (UPF0249 family)